MAKRKRPTLAQLTKQVEQWNVLYGAGVEVEYWTGARTEHDKPKHGTTDGEAFILGGHTACVAIYDGPRCIALSHVREFIHA